MDKDKLKIEIPEYVVLTSDEESFSERFVIAVGGLNSNYTAIMGIADLKEVIPETVQDIKPESVNSFIDERINEITSTKMLTIEAKENAKKDWEDIRKQAISLITSIRNFFERYPMAKVTLVGERLVVVNSHEVMFEACKRPVPQEIVAKHYNLLQNVRDAIDTLWAFERDNDWPSGNLFNLEQGMKMLGDPEQFAKDWVYHLWLKEYRKQHPYLDGAYAVKTKNSLVEQNRRLSEARKKYFEEHPEDFVQIHKRDPYEKMRGASAEDCLHYSVEMK